MKTFLIIVLSLVFGFVITNPIKSCTNIIVTKGASSDGSSMITYSADSHTLYGELYYKPAKDYPIGAKMDIFEWDRTGIDGKFLGKIRQAKHTNSVVGNINEFQLVIAETTYGGREELPDSTSVLDYGNLIYITLQRAKTARAAIDTISNLLNEYGYYSEGETFSIGDPNESWIMDIIGKGSPKMKKDKNGKLIKEYNKGALWVALRVPDGYICAHANQSRIKQFPLNDPESCKYSKDVISFARQKGWYNGEDKNFSFADTYAPLTFDALRFCEARVYSVFRRVSPSLNLKDDYIKGNQVAEPMPMWVKPDKKISVKDAMALMRDHYEGTDLDMTIDAGSGPYHCPYRWRPLTWKVDSVEYFNERAISTQQTGFSFVSQLRSWLPDFIGGILWFGVDDTYGTVYVPMYCGMTEIPEPFAEKNGDFFHFSSTSAFWTFNQVNNFSYLRYSDMIVDIQKAQKELENKFFSFQPAIEMAALELSKSQSISLAKKYLNEYSINQSEITLKRWQKLSQDLVVKYMDGNIKDENGKVLHPQYPQWWYKNIINETGDKLKVKKISK